MCLSFCILHSECPSNIAFFSRGIKICLGGCQAWIVNVPISPGCPPVRQKNCFLTPDTPISFNSQNSTQLSRLKLIFRWSSISSILPLLCVCKIHIFFRLCVRKLLFTWCVFGIALNLHNDALQSLPVQKNIIVVDCQWRETRFLGNFLSHWFDWKLV